MLSVVKVLHFKSCVKIQRKCQEPSEKCLKKVFMTSFNVILIYHYGTLVGSEWTAPLTVEKINICK